MGIKINDSLKYHAQIDFLESKLSRLCGLSYRLRGYFNKKTAKTYYYSLVYSTLIYCICVWGGILQCTQRGHRLVRMQEKIINNLFGKYVTDDACIFKEFRLLKLRDIHRFYMGIYMFKVINLDMCPTLQNDLNLCYPVPTYNTRNFNDIQIPFPRVDASKINFKYQISKIWNEIPRRLRELSSLHSFKREFILYFLEQYWKLYFWETVWVYIHICPKAAEVAIMGLSFAMHCL